MLVYLQKPDNLRHWAHLITYSNEIKSMADDVLNLSSMMIPFERKGWHDNPMGLDCVQTRSIQQNSQEGLVLQT